MIGTSIGPYLILAPIGAGGMGEVYRARDTKLDRDVAIKILPDSFAHDAERVARFEREAKVLAALNHPNIAQIYGLEERALVMELVEGPTLAERIAQGAVPLDEALNIAKQIAEALETAHEKGITHRDLKPANVKLRPDGTVKVLDFGLATAAQSATADGTNATISPTLTLDYGATRSGMIMGTAAYMSPEQAVGKPVDRRTDIWSFGVLLHEMLTGRRLFEGETISHVLADVIRGEIDFSRLPASTPTAIWDLLKRCLDRDVKNRLQWIGEARIAIDKSGREPEIVRPPVFLDRNVKTAWAMTAAMGVVTVALAFIHFREAKIEPHVSKTHIIPTENFRFTEDSFPAVSPDGRHIAFVVAPFGQRAIIQVRDLDSLASRSLPGTEGAQEPFWSPDSRFLGFFANGKLKKIDINGGPPLTLCDAPPGLRGTWSQKDVIVFSPGTRSALFRVPAEGGNPTAVSVLDRSNGEVSHRNPWFLPDGRHFLYTAAMGEAADKIAVYIGDLDSKNRIRVPVSAKSNAIYAAPGYLLFVRENTLMAQPFDARKLEVSGTPVLVAEQVDYYFNRIHHQFSASQNGVLVYTSGITAKNTLQLTWFDQSGKITGTVGAPGDIDWGELSPNGKTVAVSRRDPQTGVMDLWLEDLARGTSSRLTFGPRDNRWPVWSPDGSYVAFRNSRSGYGGLYDKPINGGEERLLDETTPRWDKRPVDWSHDGRYILETYRDVNNRPSEIWVLPTESSHSDRQRPFPYLQTAFNNDFAKLSPDGSWLAYVSDETRRAEVYVTGFPKASAKWQISTKGGQNPVWSRDGRELFFIAPDQKLMAVEIKGGTTFEAGIPRPLFDSHIGAAPGAPSGSYTWFDVSRDGRFLIPAQVDQNTNTPMTVVVNWVAGLKKQ